MRKNIQQINGDTAMNTAVSDTKNVTEYKIGHTTYIVTLHFNTNGESLTDILNRLIGKSAEHISAA